jgi:hypothetical protein
MDVPTVVWKRCPEERPMGRQSPAIRATVGNDDPTRNLQRIPTAVANDGSGQATSAPHCFQQVVHVHELSLELHDQERSSGSVPSEHVDDSALPVDVERDLRGNLPIKILKQSRHDLVHGGVVARAQSCELAASPPCPKLDSDFEGS